jgi:hypothetical protein
MFFEFSFITNNEIAVKQGKLYKTFSFIYWFFYQNLSAIDVEKKDQQILL